MTLRSTLRLENDRIAFRDIRREWTRPVAGLPCADALEQRIGVTILAERALTGSLIEPIQHRLAEVGRRSVELDGVRHRRSVAARLRRWRLLLAADDGVEEVQLVHVRVAAWRRPDRAVPGCWLPRQRRVR